MIEHRRFHGQLVDQIADKEFQARVNSSKELFSSPYLSLTQDEITLADETFTRIVVKPHDAVGILAVDEDNRILLLSQYRHPQSRIVIEIPAGTCDLTGEDVLGTAQRELAEEADLVAESWENLLELTMSPGYSTERLTVFLATKLSESLDQYERKHEESDLEYYWITPEAALEAIDAGLITDAKTVAAIHAYDRRNR